MAKISFSLDGDKIVGWNRGKEVPPGNVEVDQARLDAYLAAQKAMRAAGRREKPEYRGNAVVTPNDRRDRYRITADRAEDSELGAVVLDADGVDAVTLTIEKLRPNDTPDPRYDVTRVVELGDRFFKLAFVDGVATKALKAAVSGELVIRGNPDFRLVSPIKIVAAE